MRKAALLSLAILLIAGALLVAQEGPRATAGSHPQELADQLLREIQRDLRIVRHIVRRGDLEARSLGFPGGLSATDLTAQAQKLESRLGTLQQRWRDLEKAGSQDGSRIYEQHLQALAAQSGRLTSRARRVIPVEIASLRIRAGLLARLEKAEVSATGGIAGTITQQGTTTGLSGIQVTVFDDSDSWVTQVSTDSLGEYEAPNLDDGTYFVKTYNYSGYVDELYDNIPCPGGSWGLCDHLSGTPVVVSGGSTTSGIDFKLRVGGTVSGTVTAEGGGAAIEGNRVDIYNPDGDWMSYGYTDASGDYSGSQGLTTGTYYAMTDNGDGYLNEIFDNIPCDPPGWGCDPTTGTPISVTLGSDTSGIDFALVKGGTISGTITDQSSGLPIESVGVEIYDSSGSYVTDGYADSNGVYTSYQGLPSGTYHAVTYNYDGYLDELYNNIDCPGGYCDVTTGTSISVTAGSDTSGIDFALAKGGSISGTITDEASGLPIEDTNVNIYDSSGDYVGYGYSDTDGTYTSYAGLPSGTYYARTNNYDGYFAELYDDIDCSSGCDVTTGTPINVTVGSDTSGIDFALAKGGTISGTITDLASGLPIDSYPGVEIYDSSGDYVTYGSTDSNGVYTSYQGLVSGTYHAVTYNYDGYLDELYNNIDCPGGNCDVTTGTSISVTAGSDTSGIDFALAKGGTISGTITDVASGLPIYDSRVRFYDSSGDYLGYSYTDSNGVYTSYQGLPSGTFYARTDLYSGGYLDELYDNIDCSSGCDVTTGTPISVTLGSDTSGIDFALVKGGTISGTLTDVASGLPIEYTYVDIYDSSGYYVTYGYTDSNGVYTSYQGLPSGTYHAVTYNYDGYLDELYDNIPCPGGWDCDVTTGTPISVTLGADISGIDFALRHEKIFGDGFESGDTSGWSRTVP